MRWGNFARFIGIRCIGSRGSAGQRLFVGVSLGQGGRLSIEGMRLTEELNGGAVTVECADIDVGSAGADAVSQAALGDVGVDEGAEVFVLFIAGEPKLVEVMEDLAGHSERAPNPVGGSVALLDLNLLNSP